jgi:hypothetical protein
MMMVSTSRRPPEISRLEATLAQDKTAQSGAAGMAAQ